MAKTDPPKGGRKKGKGGKSDHMMPGMPKKKGKGVPEKGKRGC